MSVCKHHIQGYDFCQDCWDDLVEERDEARAQLAVVTRERDEARGVAEQRNILLNIFAEAEQRLTDQLAAAREAIMYRTQAEAKYAIWSKAERDRLRTAIEQAIKSCGCERVTPKPIYPCEPCSILRAALAQ